MTAIEFENISKQYRLGLVSTGTIANDLNRWWTMNILRREDPYLKVGETNDRTKKGSSEYVWALKDINFKVEQGDVVGIIGKNGAGKSTLLKLLSRVTAPTTGCIKARGRIASLLEVGTGFHPEMTGRENIYLNGAIMGMTKAEVSNKLDEIVDFSGCERYIDTPVKRYSSGMTVRLGFAIAAHLEPEILVVDEVLAVGDAEFQKKAIGKMQDVSKGGGRTVLFVSHNMSAVEALCKHGIVIENGQIDFVGSAEDSVNHYISNSEQEMTSYWKPSLFPNVKVDHRYDDVVFESIELVGGKVDYNTVDSIAFDISLYANSDIPNCRINLTICTIADVPVGTVMSNDFFSIVKGERKTVRITVYNHNMVVGAYYANFAVGYGTVKAGIKDFEIIFKPIQFKISKYSDSILYYNWGSYRGNTYFPYKQELLSSI